MKGFTLVETLVAISILMLGILGPLSVASTGLRSSVYARDQITAYYLAQEGIETVRYMRDYNYIYENGWLEGLDDCLIEDPNDDGCAFDIPEWFEGENVVPDVDKCSNGQCVNKKIYITPEGLYTHTPGGNEETRYRRVVTITPIGDGSKEAKVVSTITWETGGFSSKTFSVTENIFNLY